jgi:ryanodine receptor 2
LGRCAPSEETIKMGKSDSIRARSILRSLVSMEDLEGVLGLRFILPIPGQANDRLPGLQPSHKMSIISFLDRVYGIPDQNTFFRLIESAFLPDIRTATILDSVRFIIYLLNAVNYFYLNNHSFLRAHVLKMIWH